MPRNTFTDIVPPQRKSIRNVSRSRNTLPPEDRGEEEASRPPHFEPEHDDMPPPPPPPQHLRRPESFFSRYGVWIVALIVLILIVFAFSVLFSGSKVVVTPKQNDVTVNGTFTAEKDAVGNALPFEVMVLEESVSETVDATGTETAEERASGRIVIYNDFSSDSQRLVTNTRFETPDGLIYRVREPVVVPGKSGETPGSIEVSVYADEPGETYNIGLSDFTIPGFKGSPQFDAMYARSKTPMTGGFVGERVAVSEADLTAATGRLETTLNNTFLEKARTELPEGYMLFDDAVTLTLGDPRILDSGTEDKALIELTGTAHAVILKESALAESIARGSIAAYENEPIRFEEPVALTLTLLPTEDEPFDPATSEVLTFELEGSARLVWIFDAEQLKEDLSGQPKEAVSTILPGHRGIDKAQVILRPFWKREFPQDPDKIVIETKLPE